MLGRIPTRFSMDAISLLFFFFSKINQHGPRRNGSRYFCRRPCKIAREAISTWWNHNYQVLFGREREREMEIDCFLIPFPPRGFTISFLHYRPMRLSGFSLIGSTTEKREREKQSRALLKSTISIVASLSVRPNVTGVLLKRERVHFRSRRQNCKRGSNKKKGDVQAPIELPLSA